MRNASIDVSSVYVELQKIMAEAFGIDTIYHTVKGRHVFHFRSETAMDDYIGKFVDDYESAVYAAKRNARTIYTETLRQAQNSSENTQRRKTGKHMGDDYSW